MKPKISASLILCRENLNSSFEVLMIRRKENLQFSNSFVFPGGSMDPPDLSPSWLSLTSSSKEIVAKTDFSEEVDLSALRITAIRETWEETGVLLADKPVAKGSDFLQSCKDFGSVPKIEKLHYFCRIIAPEPIKKRYDTVFFICIENPESIQVDNIEADQYVWATPDHILGEYLQGRIIVWPPQLYILKRLSMMKNLTELFWRISEIRKVPLLFQIGTRDNKRIESYLPGDYRHNYTPSELRAEKPEHYMRIANGVIYIFINQLAEEYLSRLFN